MYLIYLNKEISSKKQKKLKVFLLKKWGGINIQCNLSEISVQYTTSSLKNYKKFDMWHLSMKGRVVFLKTKGLSHLVYPADVLDVPTSIIKQIKSAIYHLYEKNKCNNLNKNILSTSCKEGGLNVLNLKTPNIILKLN